LGGLILEVNISYVLIFSAIAFSFFIGTIAGLFPALQASKMNPVEALRK
jgi:ABC-type antimicrobial peptide transport system permease subunit